MATKTQKLVYREAILKKNKTLADGTALKAGDTVLVTEKFIVRGRVDYHAVKKEGGTSNVKVTASEFEYTDSTDYVVCVMRTTVAAKNFLVKAKTREEAKGLAVAMAGNVEFTDSGDVEYEPQTPLTIEEHKDTFQTETVNLD